MSDNKVKTVAIRVDASPLLGMGHLSRCTSLALAVRQHLGIEPFFLLLQDSIARGAGEYLKTRGFMPHAVSSQHDDKTEDMAITRKLFTDFSARLLVTDIIDPDPADHDLQSQNYRAEAVTRYIAEIRSWEMPSLSFSDRGTFIQIRPDVVISCHPRQQYQDYCGVKETRFLLGPDYFVLGSDFLPFLNKAKRPSDKHVNILSIFGGSDFYGYSLKTANALRGLPGARLTTILGPAVRDAENAAAELTAMGVTVARNVPSVASYMSVADLAITAGGNTLFELAALGTPSVVLCARDRQHEYADYFAARGCVVNLGMASQVSAEQIRQAVTELIQDAGRRREMGKQGKKLVDGRGTERVVQVIGELLA